VFLNLDSFSVTGPGTVGIHIFPNANAVFLEGGPGDVTQGNVTGWTYGVEDEGNNFIQDFVYAQNNIVAGDLVHDASGSNINDFVNDSNGKYGIWLVGSSYIQVNCSDTDDNGDTGVEIGCRDSSSDVCYPNFNLSSHNKVYDHFITSNGQYGIRI
jgi:hypothetical protein